MLFRKMDGVYPVKKPGKEGPQHAMTSIQQTTCACILNKTLRLSNTRCLSTESCQALCGTERDIITFDRTHTHLFVARELCSNILKPSIYFFHYDTH